MSNNQIYKDFTFSNKKKDLVELKFMKNISKTNVCVSKKTGLVFHNKYRTSLEVLNNWTNKIFSNKKDPNRNYYTDNIPGMRSRHFFVLDFLSRIVEFKNKKIIDFACGEGGLLLLAKKFYKIKNLLGVEHSKKNILKIKKRFKSQNLKNPILINSTIEDFLYKEKVDIGILTWTLCNCSEPIKIIESISKNLKKNGYLIVAESSRILVPYKKPIFNCFVKNIDCGEDHPWHWSFNSLINIFKFCGFELVKNNRYWDENDLVLVFKNSKKFNQKYNFDNYLKVISFLKRWKKESKNYDHFRKFF